MSPKMGTLRILLCLGLLLVVVENARSQPTDVQQGSPVVSEDGSESLKKETPHTFLEKLVEGETKQKLEELFEADLQYHEKLDAADKVHNDIEETTNEIKFTEDSFKKTTDTRMMAKEYYAKLEDHYRKYEHLKMEEEGWTAVEGSVPATKWREMEGGVDVLQTVQQAKEKVKFQMKELKPEHDVYESKKEDIERENETPEETRQQVYQTTLNDLNSQLQKLTKDKKQLEEDLEADTAKREMLVISAAASWVNVNKKRSNWGKFRGIFEESIQKFSNKEDGSEQFEKKLFPIPSIIQGNLEHGFIARMKALVYEYETSINGDLEEKAQDNDITKKQKEIEMDKMLYRMENNILAGHKYALTSMKRSEDPLRRENALLEVVEEIVARAMAAPDKKLDKEMAKEILAKTKLLASFITSNSSCNIASKGFSLEEDKYNAEIDRVLNAFESAARDLVLVPAVDAEDQGKKQEEVDKKLRLVQDMMNDLSGLVSCVKTLMRIEKTVADAEAWRAKL